MNIYFWCGMAFGALGTFVFIEVLACCLAGKGKQEHIDRNKEQDYYK